MTIIEFSSFFMIICITFQSLFSHFVINNKAQLLYFKSLLATSPFRLDLSQKTLISSLVLTLLM